MLKFNIIGSIFGSTGYDSHTRSLFNALAKVADVKLSTSLISDWQRLVNDAELDAIIKPNREKDINLIITTPHNWKMYLGLGMNIGYCIWEGDKVPKSYIEEFINPKIDLIFVASSHTFKAIVNTIEQIDINGEKLFKAQICSKIRIIPHGVDLNLFYKKDIPRTDNKFRFICNKGWRGTYWDRGGVQYLLKAFAEEFKTNENVELILKLNPCYINPQIISQVITNLSLPVDRASIQINVEAIPFNKLVDLYNKADIFVCSTRGDAFNLGGIEAMACGLPTIQTAFGGQTDYMNESNSFKTDYDLELVREDIMYEGIQWATPKINDLKTKMRYAFENQQIIKEMGQHALEDSKNWTWDISAQKIIDCLYKIE